MSGTKVGYFNSVMVRVAGWVELRRLSLGLGLGSLKINYHRKKRVVAHLH